MTFDLFKQPLPEPSYQSLSCSSTSVRVGSAHELDRIMSIAIERTPPDAAWQSCLLEIKHKHVQHEYESCIEQVMDMFSKQEEVSLSGVTVKNEGVCC